MAAVDPYSPCPCGSGQKYKWCCHKVEAQAERAHRLYHNGQVETAIHALDEALRKDPQSPLLLIRKAMYQIALEQLEPAKEVLRQLLEKSPQHPTAHLLLTQLVVETEGPTAGTAQLQQAMSSVSTEHRPALAEAAALLGMSLARFGSIPAALVHLMLAAVLAGGDRSVLNRFTTINRDRSIPAWLRNPYRLSDCPPELSGEARERFTQAMAWANSALWSSAASAFDVLSAEKGPAADVAERNLGLCRLWLADEEGAVGPLRRSIARLGNTEDAVDIEALCQQIETPGPDEVVELVQLSWPLRDRDRLVSALNADPSVGEAESEPIDDDAPASAEVARFRLLDRPALKQFEGLRVEDMPTIVGRVFVGHETAGIETFDDGRLDGLAERFTELAAGAIPPAHPKTRVIEKIARANLSLSWEWYYPDGLPPAERARLLQQKARHVFEDVWPKTPMTYLGGRTPLEAAKAGGYVVPLRAAVLMEECAPDRALKSIDFAAVRAKLGLEPEPPIDPAAVDVARLSITRLGFIPVDQLDDDKLGAVYHRARGFGLDGPLEAAARALLDRPQAREKAELNLLGLYSDLAQLATGRRNWDEALEWVAKGRRSDSPADQVVHAPFWDMAEIRIRARSQAPKDWVPELAVVLDRYGEVQSASEVITLGLMELGLIRMAPNPDDEDDVLMDTRPLQMLMSKFGPRVSTASGKLGVSAAKGGIWTPGSEAAGGGTGLWTPGSGPGQPSEGEGKPKLIIPGR